MVAARARRDDWQLGGCRPEIDGWVVAGPAWPCRPGTPATPAAAIEAFLDAMIKGTG